MAESRIPGEQARVTMRIPNHCTLLLICLVAATQVSATGDTPPLPDRSGLPPLVKHLITYVLPFVAYYVGILVRYHAKFLHDSTPPPLGEQLVAGIVFSVVAVAPLIPSIRLAVLAAETIDLVAYMLVVVVIMQEGLVLHERAVAGVRKLVRRGESPSAP